ncbi:zinc finger, CCHC-type, retrotransposon gag domain protein [Tanacetum coccineum]
MVNTRTDAELAAAVQAAVDAMLPQIREQVREEYRTGAVASGSNPPPVTIHTWLERFNKQKPRSFEKAVAPVDAENWISHMEKIFDVMDCNDAFKTRLAVYKFEGDALAWWKAYKQAKGGDAWVLTLTWAAFKELFFLQFFPRAEQERLKREYHSIRQRASENSTEYMQRFLRLAGFLGQAAGTAEEQAKNFRWGLHKSILDHVMCIQFTDVAQVADAARNLEILRDRDDYDRSERSDKRHKSGDRYHPYSQQGSHRSHGQSDDRQRSDMQGSDRQSSGSNYRNNNNSNHSRDNNRNSGAGRDQRNRGSQQSRVPSEGYTHPVCNTCGRRHPGECRRAAGTCFKCGQAGHLQRDCKKNTGASSSGHADKKPDASGRVFALTQDQAANTSGTITGALFIFGRAVFVLFDTGATHSVISTKLPYWDTFEVLGYALWVKPMQSGFHGVIEQGLCMADDRGVTEGREDVREVFQQRGSGAKRNLSNVRISIWRDVRTLAIEEAYTTKYSIHPGADTMLCGFRLTNRWLSMKKDIASCGSKYLAYSEVEVEYQGSSGLLLQPKLPE